MVKELLELVDYFSGPANQTQCFTHVLNFVVKSILWQFDLPKSKSDVLSREGKGGVAAEEPEDDNVEGWIDEWTLMDNDDVGELEEIVKPVCWQR